MPQSILKLKCQSYLALEKYVVEHPFDVELKGLYLEFREELKRNIIYVERKTDTHLTFKEE
jgi:hypothetical protein